MSLRSAVFGIAIFFAFQGLNSRVEDSRLGELESEDDGVTDGCPGGRLVLPFGGSASALALALASAI
eukprot:1733718-Pyramimonas_sp.AAC.1